MLFSEAGYIWLYSARIKPVYTSIQLASNLSLTSQIILLALTNQLYQWLIWTNLINHATQSSYNTNEDQSRKCKKLPKELKQ